MKGNYLEAEKLIDCLKAVINQQKIPPNDLLMDWELFYKTSDFHHVSNMVYYAVLGMRPAVPQDWMGRFSSRYRRAVVQEDQYAKLTEAVFWNCEQNGIHIMALDNWIFRRFYPMPEMRLTESMEFLVEGKKRPEIDSMMYRLDFIPEESVEPEAYSYSRSGLKLVFREKLIFGNRKLTRYFSMPVRALPKEEDKNYIHKLHEPGLFIFLMCKKAQRFTDGEFGLRDMVDIWLYYRSVIRGNSWKYIIQRLSRLGVWRFTNKMLALTDIWFGGGSPGEDIAALEELENFIFYKGTQGQDTAMKLLPLLRHTVKKRKKQMKKEKRKKLQRWMFPGRDYMVLLYPRMGKYLLLLPLCWLRRLLRSFGSCLKMKLTGKSSET